MNDNFSKFAALTLCAMLSVVCHTNGVLSEDSAGKQPSVSSLPHGQTLVRDAAKQTASHRTIEGRMRVKTDLLGQPLIGSGSYAQLQSSTGAYLRLELAIQAGEQATSVKQLSDGRDLWEHWRIAGEERLNYINLQRVNAEVAAGRITGATSASLATGGLPRLLQQLHENFDFSKSLVRTGMIADVPIFAITGVWHSDRLAAAAPQSVEEDTIHFERLPPHLPHQVELMIGQNDYFPYRVTYHRYHQQDGKYVLKPAVTTEFFEVAVDQDLDQGQFLFRKPKINFIDKTDAFLKSLGPNAPKMASGAEDLKSR